MNVRLDFVDEAGRPAADLTIRGKDGRYPLPRIRLRHAGDRPWPDQVTARVDDDSRSLVDAATVDSWAAAQALLNDPGDGSLVGGEMSMLLQLFEPAVVRLQCRVRYYESAYELLQRSSPRVVEESVTIRLQPEAHDDTASRGTGQWTSQPGRADRSRHLGHAAIDFGTSNCTVTLFDQQELPKRQLSRRQAARLRHGTAALLAETAWLAQGGRLPVGAADEWQQHVAEIGRAVLGGSVVGLADEPVRLRLVDELRHDDDAAPRWLYEVLVEVERRRGRCSEQLRPRLAGALTALYAGTWRVPALDRLKLFPVALSPSEGEVVESKVTVESTLPLQVTVGRPKATVVGRTSNASAPRVFAGLKQKLEESKPVPGLDGVGSDDLIREAIGFLLRRTDDFIASPGDGGRLGTGSVARAVVTYPTMSSPAVRRKLKNMVAALGVADVVTSYDEAVATAMFFLMRDFGGDHDIGLESLRARSTPIEPLHWEQNVLVIDIGGGTADVALLTLGLRDATTPDRTADPRVRGRYYELRPELRGSTGRLQNGGELVTLRIFYWIKATLADRLRVRQPERYAAQNSALAQLAGTRPAGTTAHAAIGDDHLARRVRQQENDPELRVMDEILHTRWAAPRDQVDAEAQNRFWTLWELAEGAKLELCDPDDPKPSTTIDGNDLAFLVPDAPDPDVLTLELVAGTFEDLVRADIDEVMYSARELVRSRLGSADPASAGGAAGRLDRIILTGQASRAPLVRRRLLAAFASSSADELGVEWHPSGVLVEQEFSKQSTSLGACWAEMVRQTQVGEVGAQERLRQGHNALHIDVDNLFFNLPCSLRRSETLGQGGQDGLEVLHVGQELEQLDPAREIAAVRSKPFEPAPTVAVYRDGYGDYLLRLGEFQVGPDLDPEIWPKQISAILEVTAELNLWLLLSHGEPHHRVGRDPDATVLTAVRDAGDGDAVTISSDGRELLTELPGAIVVNAMAADGQHRGTVVVGDDDSGDVGIPASEEQIEGHQPAGRALDRTLHVAGDEHTVVAGLVGERSFGAPGPSGRWTFHYRGRSGRMELIDEIPAPQRLGQLPLRYRVSLDEHGGLRVHAGAVPFWETGSIHDVQKYKGIVYRHLMERTGDDYEAKRDPFNGTH